MDDKTLELLQSGLLYPHTHACRYNSAFQLWPHICHIGRIIGDAVEKGGARLLINLGPGTGKSELISVATPTWAISRWPTRKVLLGTASKPLAAHWGDRNRSNFRNHPRLGVTIKGDTDAKDNWETGRGGGMRAIGMGSSAVGFRANLFIIDDPYGTWADAQSSVYRREVEGWYTGTAASRLEPDASVIVLHHRMHPLDLSHFLLKGPDGARWQHICFPSIATGPDALGRKAGDAICPERYDELALSQIRKEMQYAWEPMHQQNPMALTAGAAYRHFGQHNIDPTVGYRPDLPLDLSVDFNIAPGMHVTMGHHDRATDMAWAFDEIHEVHMSVEGACAEIRRRIAAMPEKPDEIRLFGDCGGASRSISTGQSHWDAMHRGLDPLGISISNRVCDPEPRVVERLGTFNYALRDVDGQVWYKVHPRCEILIRDLVSVQLDENGKVDKSNQMLTHSSEGEGHRMYFIRGMRVPVEMPEGQFVY